MLTLRITQTAGSDKQHRVEAALEGDGLPRQTATSEFDFGLAVQDQEDLRWYLEDYLQYPHDPAPKIAARIERRITEIGAELFRALFQSGDDTRDQWATLRTRLNDTRVEVVTGLDEASTIPWELVRDPKTDVALALRTNSFVRTHPNPAQRPDISPAESGPIRILLVICRPGRDDDVPFRSVASRLIKGLSDEARAAFKLDVLRPPTFEQLGRTLREAKARGEPYHVVHFDGHGMYTDVPGTSAALEWLRGLTPLMLSGQRDGPHGFLLFENPLVDENLQLVDGPAVGSLLVETDVPLLVLNACRSAHAEPPTAPETAESAGDDPHVQVRALGSLAQEVMDAGVAGVVAMRYNVYVVTAAQFVADLYGSLAQGRSLGEAVSLGRKQLDANPLREIAFDPRPLQDWAVPVVYEATPISLFPKPDTAAKLNVALTDDEVALEKSDLDPELPKRPYAGFFGRDETLLALDRAFDTQSVVLLHAFAGSGKTATAAEFARWYHLTGGLDGGPVLFTSFDGPPKSLPRVLDQIERVFGPALEQEGIQWLTLDDAERRSVALQVLKQKPVLWVWDNVEPIAGFPANSDSAWTPEEQSELADFLRDARDTKAKLLLTSRRDERDWLGDHLPARVTVPPMPTQERVQLARALVEKHGRRLTDVDDWRPLLRFTQGNPLTITVLVGQALRDGLTSSEQIGAFVDRLRRGEAAFEDEASEGRSSSLGASLSYGFEHAFTKAERKQLALLHLFQDFVDVDVLRVMGRPDADWSLPEVRGLTREEGMALLDRAAEVGLLTAHGGGYYAIHPALPWFFKTLFDHYYSQQPTRDTQKPLRAFVGAVGELGNYYHRQYNEGNREVIAALTAEEPNLLHARQLARTHGWWGRVTGTMQGLSSLYEHTGRRTEWSRLLGEIVPDFVDPATDGPLPGREDGWSVVTEYRARLAREARQWTEAERLQRINVEWARQRAASALASPPKELDAAGRHAIQTVAAALGGLAHILREQAKRECVSIYEEDYDLSNRIGSKPDAAVAAFNLGHVYKDIPAVRDLEQAERWYRSSLDMYEEHERLDRAQCLGQLGNVAVQRFREARDSRQPDKEVLRHLNDALRWYLQVLDMVPGDAVKDLAVTHNALGVIYGDAGDIDGALTHYRDAIRYLEAQGDLYSAAGTRFNVAFDLAGAGRFADAFEYANAALRNYETYGDRAAKEIQRTRELIAVIERGLQAQGGEPSP